MIRRRIGIMDKSFRKKERDLGKNSQGGHSYPYLQKQPVLFVLAAKGTRDRTRTDTDISVHWILSPTCLPISPLGPIHKGRCKDEEFLLNFKDAKGPDRKFKRESVWGVRNVERLSEKHLCCLGISDLEYIASRR